MSKSPKIRKPATTRKPKTGGKAVASKLLSGTDKAVAARKANAAAKALRTKPKSIKPTKGVATPSAMKSGATAKSGAAKPKAAKAPPVAHVSAAQTTVLAGKTFNAAATEAGGAGVKSGGGAGRSLGGHVRVLTARRRSNSSTRWLARQLNDPYVRAAKAAGYRSRAAYKLIELDEQFGLFAGVSRVIDLGAAPGGWCQAVLAARPKAKIVAIDLLEMEPLPGVTIFVKDILDDDSPVLLREALGGSAQLVLSDMAANTVGHKPTDHIRTMALVQTALDFAVQMLGPGGAFVAKVLAGGADPELVSALKRHFVTVRHAKPPASRKGSSEWYVVGQGFKGLATASKDDIDG